MKAKRILAVFVGAAMVCSMAACGSSSDSSDAAEDADVAVSEEVAEETADDAEEEESTGTEIAFEETTYVDNEDYTFTVEGITIGEDGCMLDVEITNKSADQNYVFEYMTNVNVDGVELYGKLSQDVCEIAAGQTANGTLKIENHGLQGLNYTDLEIMLEGEETELQSETFHVYPYGEENASAFVWEAQESDQVLVDNDYVTIALLDVSVGDDYLCMYYYLNNKSDWAQFDLSSEDSVDGNVLEDPVFSKFAEPGQTVDVAIVYEEELGGESVKDVKTIESTISWTMIGGDESIKETVSINLQ